MKLKAYQRDCSLGAIGALLMLAGDLCLSVIPASAGDGGLFAREAYLNGSWQTWRLPLLLATGLIGMALGFFTVRASCMLVDRQSAKTRRALLAGGVVYVASAGVLHFFIGSLADWTARLAPVLGREETKALVQEQYARLMPPMLIAYAGMVLFILTSFFAVLTKKTPPAALDACVSPDRLADRACTDSGYPAAAGSENLNLGFCAEPGLG